MEVDGSGEALEEMVKELEILDSILEISVHEPSRRSSAQE